MSEDQMEIQGKYDLGDVAKSKDWEWRDIALPVKEVYKIISFNSTKSIVELYDTEERILVAEKFEALVERWEELTQKDDGEPLLDLSPEEECGEETN